MTFQLLALLLKEKLSGEGCAVVLFVFVVVVVVAGPGQECAFRVTKKASAAARVQTALFGVQEAHPQQLDSGVQDCPLSSCAREWLWGPALPDLGLVVGSRGISLLGLL